jgi:hypothetical protein
MKRMTQGFGSSRHSFHELPRLWQRSSKSSLTGYWTDAADLNRRYRSEYTRKDFPNDGRSSNRRWNNRDAYRLDCCDCHYPTHAFLKNYHCPSPHDPRTADFPNYRRASDYYARNLLDYPSKNPAHRNRRPQVPEQKRRERYKRSRTRF